MPKTCWAVMTSRPPVVLKPSHITPGVGEWLSRCWQRAVPDLPGVFQNLIGFGATG
jgi:succinate-semialdehyde dehydrogenase / glutarate-semialdehyde dehydrogenase